jgi:hypothetical protein
MNDPKASILDGAIAARGWNPADDPGNICIKYPKPKAAPICHCPQRQKGRLGGMDPSLDLDARVIRCRTCLREIGPGCRTREVMWLRGLLSLSETNPEHFDAESIPDKIFCR